MRWKRGDRLRLTSETQAPAGTRQVFDEVRQLLGVPQVPVLYRAYAAFPEFLEVHWRAFRPVLQPEQFFQLGARLAAECYTRAHNYFEVRDLSCPDWRRGALAVLPLAEVLDYFLHLDPLLLLIATAQMQAFEGPVGQASASSRIAMKRPSYLHAPALVSDSEVSPKVQRIWDERRMLHNLSFVSDEHRALARWSQFYQEYWNELKGLLQSPLGNDSQYRIADSAWGLVRELPGRIETPVTDLYDAGIGGEEVTSLVRINQALVQAYSGLMLDVTFARIGCEGGTALKHQPAAAPAPAESTPPRAA